MRVAVTGSGGRLGSALTALLRSRPFVSGVLAWDLPEHDLDDPESAERLISRNRPDAVIHAAAWTDVDGCARDPKLAMRRNGLATGEMARACASMGAAMVMISTNEVFDGRRTDGLPYGPADATNPANPYGAAKLAGELEARKAFCATDRSFAAAATGRAAAGSSRPPALAIVRTAWLFGLPGADFPQKILAAAEKARAAGQTLSLVSDEVGCPTYALDLAAAIVDLLEAWRGPAAKNLGGIHHMVNGGYASRAEWAREVLRIAGVDVPTRDVPLSTWPRPSTPPLWGVLQATPLPLGPMRSWQSALLEYSENPAEERGGWSVSEDTSKSRLEGVGYGRLARYADRRGSFMETWRASAFGELTEGMTGMPAARFVQANLSTSAQGVLRGLHYHRRQLDYWIVVGGRALVALVDVRPVLADQTARALVELRELGVGETVTIPTGVAHGFLAVEPLQLMYLVTNEYDGSDELGFAWDDPAVGVPWPAVTGTPDGRPILSDRDLSNPTLAELVRNLR